jgi:pyruvate dehydrogenase E2 component (dihydrolipoamide acetyltransferase)
MIEIIMPRLSDTMEEGTIVAWRKQPGDQVERGDVLAEIETDKATMDLEAFDEGLLDRIEVEARQTVPIGTVIARLRSPGEPSGPDVPTGSDSVTVIEPTATPQATPVTEPALATRPNPNSPGDRQIKASPLAKAVARERGIDLGAILGSGPGGRIVRADVERPSTNGDDLGSPGSERTASIGHDLRSTREVSTTGTRTVGTGMDSGSSSDTRGDKDGEESEALSSMRAIVARRMSESARDAPHFYATMSFAAESLLAHHAALRRALADREGSHAPSLNDLVVKAVATALGHHRDLNASFAGDRIIYHQRVHIGVAVALQGGLIVPVLRDANSKSLSVLAGESRELTARARAGTLRPEEFRGSTFTVSNLGMFGIEHFTAIINPPEAAILAVGAVRDEPVVRDGMVVPGKICSLTLSSDHRVVDGAAAARFLAELKELLEEPLLFLTG